MSKKIHPLIHSKVFWASAFVGLVVIGLLVRSAFQRHLMHQEVRDVQRRRDIHQAVNACYQYAVDNDGQLPPAISDTPADIGTAGLNLASDLVPEFITAIPVDPRSGDAAYTGYVLYREADGRLTAVALNAELSPVSVTR